MKYIHNPEYAGEMLIYYTILLQYMLHSKRDGQKLNSTASLTEKDFHLITFPPAAAGPSSSGKDTVNPIFPFGAIGFVFVFIDTNTASFSAM